MMRLLLLQLFLISNVLAFSAAAKQLKPPPVKPCSETDNCVLDQDLRDEIASYSNVVKDIIYFVTAGEFKGRTYDELEKFADFFGPRLSGSEVLEKSIDYMINLTNAEDINDVTTEELLVPHWLRGEESVEMLEPRAKHISVLGLGFSVATSPEGITAEVIVIENFIDLEALDNEDVQGKIVLYNNCPLQWVSYSEKVDYSLSGATKAAAKGAVASLFRSITPNSIYNAHAGVQTYKDNVTKIPTAAITTQDADLIHRLYKKNKKVVLKIKMSATLDFKTSRNTFIDLVGSAQPEKLVIVSGHIDSWDVGDGAMDDGGGLFISWAVPVILRQLNLQPKRTIRSIFYTANKFGLVGAKAYAKKHENDLGNINFIMEADEGTFTPLGLEVAASQQAGCIVAEVLKLFSCINATTLKEAETAGTDIAEIIAKGVPGAGVLNKKEGFYPYHHTEACTMNLENHKALDLNAAFYAAVAYIIADMSVEIPQS